MRDLSYLPNLLSLIFGALLLVFIVAIFFFVIKRNVPRVCVVLLSILLLISWLFSIDLLFYIVLALFIVQILITCVTNMAEIRSFTANVLKGKSTVEFFHKTKNVKPEEIYDREEVYKKVEDAVKILSKQKIGAIITFERNDDLSDIMKNGTLLNSPVNSELLQTIFYPGTRLHDGAVVIRGDKIAAASVYFTPTSRALTGKYGSRHRAAYGISETTDSVTIVVSEETGRISIAFQGELTTVAPDELLRIFEEDMSIVSETSENNIQ